MRKFLLLASLVLGCVHAASAQNPKPYPKFEFFVGYSRESVDNGGCYRNSDGACIATFQSLIKSDSDFFKSRVAMNGLETSATGNFNKYVGLKGDFSAHFKNQTVTTQEPFFTNQFVAKSRLYQLLTGPEIKARNRTAVTPFAYALAGAAHAELKEKPLSTPSNIFGSTGADTGFASALGGGVDVRVSERASIRTSFDYNPTRVDRGLFMGGLQRQDNFRTSVGVLFH